MCCIFITHCGVDVSSHTTMKGALYKSRRPPVPMPLGIPYPLVLKGPPKVACTVSFAYSLVTKGP